MELNVVREKKRSNKKRHTSTSMVKKEEEKGFFVLWLKKLPNYENRDKRERKRQN